MHWKGRKEIVFILWQHGCIERKSCISCNSDQIDLWIDTILIKIQQELFWEEIYKLILKFIWLSKGIKIVKTIPKIKNKDEEPTLLDFKKYIKGTKTVWCWIKNRYKHQFYIIRAHKQTKTNMVD